MNKQKKIIGDTLLNFYLDYSNPKITLDITKRAKLRKEYIEIFMKILQKKTSK